MLTILIFEFIMINFCQKCWAKIALRLYLVTLAFTIRFWTRTSPGFLHHRSFWLPRHPPTNFCWTRLAPGFLHWLPKFWPSLALTRGICCSSDCTHTTSPTLIVRCIAFYFSTPAGHILSIHLWHHTCSKIVLFLCFIFTKKAFLYPGFRISVSNILWLAGSFEGRF